MYTATLSSTRPPQPGIKMSSSILKLKHHYSQNPCLLSRGVITPKPKKMSVSSSLSLVLISLTIIGKSDHVLLRPGALGTNMGIALWGWHQSWLRCWSQVELNCKFIHIFPIYFSIIYFPWDDTPDSPLWARVCLIHKSWRR